MCAFYFVGSDRTSVYARGETPVRLQRSLLLIHGDYFAVTLNTSSRVVVFVFFNFFCIISEESTVGYTNGKSWQSRSTGPLSRPLWCAAAALWSWEMRALFLVCGRGITVRQIRSLCIPVCRCESIHVDGCSRQTSFRTFSSSKYGLTL